MSTRVLAWLVFAAFAALNAIVMVESGFDGLRTLIAEQNPWAVLLSVDLAISLTMVSIWLFRDARARGVRPLPYLILTAFTGSIGPLLYLGRHSERS